MAWTRLRTKHLSDECSRRDRKFSTRDKVAHRDRDTDLRSLRMRDRSTGLFAVLVAVLAFSPMTFAQTSEQSGTANAPAAAPALSHDLSGVWMQYPGGNVPGTLGMDAVNDKFRPALTPWGQAKFDANRPIVGPRAVAGKENDPVLRCEPAGPPMLITLPNPYEIVQVPCSGLIFYEGLHVWRTIWADGRALPKNPASSWLGDSVGQLER